MPAKKAGGRKTAKRAGTRTMGARKKHTAKRSKKK
jgi:hypothetical protein